MRYLKNHARRAVRLTDERLAHILTHPEMVGMEEEIELTLSQPEFIICSRPDKDAHLYYPHFLNTMVGAKWLCVVVKYLQEDAFVLTAYLTDRPRKGEQLWPPK